MFRVIAVMALSLCVLFGNSVAGARKDIQFKRGETSATVDGFVGDRDRDRYYIVAKQGQTLNVRISSANSNGIFHIYSPGYQEDGDLVLGRSMEGAREATSARLALVASGTHLIDVGSLGGGTRYRLVVALESGLSPARESASTQTTPSLQREEQTPFRRDTWYECRYKGSASQINRLYLSDHTFIQEEDAKAPNTAKSVTVGRYGVSEQDSLSARIYYPSEVLVSSEQKLEKRMWREDWMSSSKTDKQRTYFIAPQQTDAYLTCDYGGILSGAEVLSVKSNIRQISSRAQLAIDAGRQPERDNNSKVKDWLAAFVKRYGTDHETRVAAPTMAFRLRHQRALQVEPRCQMADAISSQFETSSSRPNISTNPQIQATIAETYLVALYGVCPKAFSDIVK